MKETNRSPILVEACVDSLSSAIVAEQNGVDRIELNSAIALGGLTPSLGLLKQVKDNCSLPIICMVRPRPGNFCYSRDEIELMKRDGEILIGNGADGLAFGILTASAEVDRAQTEMMVRVCDTKEPVFHRAFDCTMDLPNSLEILRQNGVRRVLTSGGGESVIDCMNQLKTLVEIAGEEIEVLAGSGIKSDNVEQLISSTGVTQIHGTFGRAFSTGTSIESRINFNSGQSLTADEVYTIDANELKNLFHVLRQMPDNRDI